MNRITVGIAILLLGGCASEPSHLDAQFGSSVAAAIEAQTLNPDAGSDTTPVMSMDGRKAASTLEAYRQDVPQKIQVRDIIDVGQ
jgi:type IV pilus biogenesis protein CpaD/CtpE